jgi:hypothetical protein
VKLNRVGAEHKQRKKEGLGRKPVTLRPRGVVRTGFVLLRVVVGRRIGVIRNIAIVVVAFAFVEFLLGVLFFITLNVKAVIRDRVVHLPLLILSIAPCKSRKLH